MQTYSPGSFSVHPSRNFSTSPLSSITELSSSSPSSSGYSQSILSTFSLSVTVCSPVAENTPNTPWSPTGDSSDGSSFNHSFHKDKLSSVLQRTMSGNKINSRSLPRFSQLNISKGSVGKIRDFEPVSVLDFQQASLNEPQRVFSPSLEEVEEYKMMQLRRRSRSSRRMALMSSRRRCRMIHGQVQETAVERELEGMMANGEPVEELLHHDRAQQCNESSSHPTCQAQQPSQKASATKAEDQALKLTKTKPPIKRQLSALELLLEIQRTGDRSLEFASNSNTFVYPARVNSDDSSADDDEETKDHHSSNNKKVFSLFRPIHGSSNEEQPQSSYSMVKSESLVSRTGTFCDDYQLSILPTSQEQQEKAMENYSMREQDSSEPPVHIAKRYDLHLDIKRKKKVKTGGFIRKLFQKQKVYRVYIVK